MGLLSRTLITADVLLSGLAEDPFSTDAVAEVHFRTHGRREMPRGLVAFLPMAVVGTLRGCKSAPTHAAPFLEICREVAGALIDCDPDNAATFRLREAVAAPVEVTVPYDGDPDAAPTDEMIDYWLRQCLPRIDDVPAGGHRRRLNAVLKVPRRRGGTPYVGPWSRNAFVGIQGTLAMFEEAARSQDYIETTRPAVAIVRRLLDFNHEVFGARPIPGFGEATVLYQLADALSVAEDPLTAELPGLGQG